MPVEGLPSAVERLLNAVLQDMMLSSYKVEGRGENTVVVLRLTPSTTTASTIGHLPLQAQDYSATYRRKCPSQLNRDRRRAEEHRRSEKKASVHATSPSGLFLPTPPPSLFHSDIPTAEKVVPADMFACSPTCVVLCSDNTTTDRQIDMTHIDMTHTDNTVQTIEPAVVFDEMYEVNVCESDEMCKHILNVDEVCDMNACQDESFKMCEGAVGEEDERSERGASEGGGAGSASGDMNSEERASCDCEMGEPQHEETVTLRDIVDRIDRMTRSMTRKGVGGEGRKGDDVDSGGTGKK